MQVVWFKRDLRITDHAPLAEAARLGPCLCLYVYEPELLQSPEFDTSHLHFINQALDELEGRISALGGQLIYRVGTMPDVLERLHQQIGIDSVWSHQETGNRVTYDRDQRVRAWAKRHGIPWHEVPQNGVVRGLQSRDGWSRNWNAWMSRSPTMTPSRLHGDAKIDPGERSGHDRLGLPALSKTDLQPGGEAHAHQCLRSFLEHRGQNYSSELSSPVTAGNACSRISPYLAWGCISMKQVVHQVRQTQAALRGGSKDPATTSRWRKSLAAFQSRLSWHCHFMQKLEDEPRIEFENMCRAYDGLREEGENSSYFDAWCAGQTGYPMVDACMRALKQHSWINFRMRAMLVSFASYHLWLHWRSTALFLARHFLDFEPGIHFSQVQMQSGTTGINALRIYSPAKQAKDHDPSGLFIRQYVPELSDVPNEYLAEPHKMPLSLQQRVGCRIGKQYPRPVVEHAKAYREARARMARVRKQDGTRAEAKSVFQRHGSRRSPSTRRPAHRRQSWNAS